MLRNLKFKWVCVCNNDDGVRYTSYSLKRPYNIQHPENMSPKDYAKWCLLVAQAKYNNAQSLVPDSFVFKAFEHLSFRMA